MSLLSLDQILMLAGTLDDAPGFDTPRERFRRFLLTHVTQVPTARTLIEQAQHTPGDQHARALQDLVGVLGRSLGFEIHFVGPAPLSAATRPHAIWASPRQTLVVLVPSPRFPWPTARELGRAAAALRSSGFQPPATIDALVVIPPYVLTPRALEDDAPEDGPDGRAASRFPRMAHVGLSRLLSLADMVSTGRVTHADVVQLLQTGAGLDSIVEVIERTATSPANPRPPIETPVERLLPRSGCWLAGVIPDQAMTPEEVLDLVVARRQIYGIADDHAYPGTVRAGDGICFFIARKGIVGHARVASLLEAGGGLRDARRFRQVVRLERIHLHVEAPVAPDAETELRLRRAPASALRHASLLIEISSDSFRRLTAQATGSAATVVPFDSQERQTNSAAIDRPNPISAQPAKG